MIFLLLCRCTTDRRLYHVCDRMQQLFDWSAGVPPAYAACGVNRDLPRMQFQWFVLRTYCRWDACAPVTLARRDGRKAAGNARTVLVPIATVNFLAGAVAPDFRNTRFGICQKRFGIQRKRFGILRNRCGICSIWCGVHHTARKKAPTDRSLCNSHVMQPGRLRFSHRSAIGTYFKPRWPMYSARGRISLL
jgi:hypothetical protein